MFSDNNEFRNESIEENIRSDTSNSDDILDTEFSIDEVKSAMLSLKRGKSGGVDNICPEMFIDSAEMRSPILCKLFNNMFLNCIHPENLIKVIIVPVPKKGDPNDTNKYRGIKLTSIFSKYWK